MFVHRSVMLYMANSYKLVKKSAIANINGAVKRIDESVYKVKLENGNGDYVACRKKVSGATIGLVSMSFHYHLDFIIANLSKILVKSSDCNKRFRRVQCYHPFIISYYSL